MSINKPYCFLQIQLKACSHYLNPNSPRLWAITASLQVALYLLLTLILIKAFINSSFLPHQRKRGIIKIGILFFIWACTFFLIDPSFSPRDKLCPIFLRKYSLFAIQTAVFPSCTTYMQRGTGRKNKAYIKKNLFLMFVINLTGHRNHMQRFGDALKNGQGKLKSTLKKTPHFCWMPHIRIPKHVTIAIQ